MKIKIEDVVEFELSVGGIKTIETRKLVETKSHLIPSNEGPYHSGRAYDERDVPDYLTEISTVSDVGEKLLGMAVGEVKKYHRNGKSSEIKVLSINKETTEDIINEDNFELKDETIITSAEPQNPRRDELNKQNVEMIVESILEGINNMEYNYGLKYTVKYLMGAFYKKFIQYGHHRDPMFGILHFMSAKKLEQLIHILVEEDFLMYQDITTGFYGQILTISDIGRTWLELKFELPFGFQEDSNFDIDLYNDLQNLIAKIKQSRNISFPVVSTSTLREICFKKPQTKEEIRAISGIGDMFISEYADSFLNIIIKYC